MAKATFKVRQMNKTETAYFRELRDQMAVGLIKWFDYECMKFRLADSTFYTPDFAVMLASGQIELHEVKGFWADDARVKAGKCKTITALDQDGGRGKKGYVLSKIPGLAALLRGDARGAGQEAVDMPVTDIPAERADLSRFGALP